MWSYLNVTFCRWGQMACRIHVISQSCYTFYTCISTALRFQSALPLHHKPRRNVSISHTERAHVHHLRWGVPFASLASLAIGHWISLAWQIGGLLVREPMGIFSWKEYSSIPSPNPIVIPGIYHFGAGLYSVCACVYVCACACACACVCGGWGGVGPSLACY